MPLLLNRLIRMLIVGAFIPSVTYASTSPQISARPEVRIIGKVDSAKVSVIASSHPRASLGLIDQGRVEASRPFNHLKLVLKSSDSQEYELHRLMDEQQDKSSSNYHQWMTPEGFGAAFGVAGPDAVKLTTWLQISGFTVENISAGGRFIQFSGTAGQVETAFHTEIHNVLLKGEKHITNTTDISVPSALSNVIAGVSTLNDFGGRPNTVNPHPIVRGTDNQFHPVVQGTSTPDYTGVTSGNHYVGPADAATIFNAIPLQQSGFDGTGITIAVIGQSTIDLTNVETFRSIFNLPANDPTIINVGLTPAVLASDTQESDLDVDWAGALATKANVKLYTAGFANDNGIFTSALEAVDTNGGDIITMSYGGCELSDGSGTAAYWDSLWEQAAAQGQSVFVSSGDSNATGCADPSSMLATGSPANTYGVSAFGSSAYNVSVGGSEFNEGTATGVTSYWGPGGVSPYGTALSYIPETVWNEGSFDVVTAETGISGSGGGVSQFTARPVWQVGPGITATDPAGPVFNAAGAIPAGNPHRLVPDVSLMAAAEHDGTIFCTGGDCKVDSTGNISSVDIVGGTSVAAPVMAGIQALIDQKNGGRQGNANYYYYKLAAAQTTANCASSLPPGPACNFHDVVTGDNYSPLTTTGHYDFTTGNPAGKLGKDYIGFPAAAGYDPATGLGTPNVTNLANNWSTVSFNATTTTFTLTPTSVVHGTEQDASVTVASISGSGTPTGDVSFTAVGQAAGTGDQNVYPLNGGSVTAALTSLPGGTYSVVAHYAGDSVYGASDSAPITVNIAKEGVVVSGGIGGFGPSSGGFYYGSSLLSNGYVFPDSQYNFDNNGVGTTGIPTGVLTYTFTIGNTTLPVVSSPLDPFGATSLLVGGNQTSGPAQLPALAVGSYTLTLSYAGDNSFEAGSFLAPYGEQGGVNILQAIEIPLLQASATQIGSGTPVTFSVTIPTSGTGLPPTGTVSIVDSVSGTVLGSGTLVNGAVTISAVAPVGAHSYLASYAGDINYVAAVSNVQTISVGGTTIQVASSTMAIGAGAPFTLTATVANTVNPTTIPTGTVNFYDATSTGTLIGTATVMGGVGALTTAQLTVVGSHVIVAQYSGDSYSSPVEGLLPGVIVVGNPGFSVTANVSSLTLSHGSTGTVTLTATSYANYSGTGQLTCEGLPASTTCSFSPASLTFSGVNSTQMTTMTVATNVSGTSSANSASFLWLPALMLAALLGLRRKALSVGMRQAMLFGLVLLGSMALNGCGSSGPSAPTTPAGTYHVVVQVSGVAAAGSTSAATQQSIPITLTIQ